MIKDWRFAMEKDKYSLTVLNTKNLPLVDAAQLLQRFVTQVDEEHLTLGGDEVIETLMSAIRTQLPLFQNSLNKVKGSSETSTLLDLDRERDQDLQVLFDAISLHRYTKDLNKKAAYDYLRRLFASYKGIKRADYERESALLTGLLKTLAQGEAKEAVEALNIKHYVTALENSQAAFEEIFSKRARVESKKVTIDSRQLRDDLLKSYRKLGLYLELRADVIKDPVAQNLLVAYNSGRKYLADKLARQTSKKKTKPSDDEADDKEQ